MFHTFSLKMFTICSGVTHVTRFRPVKVLDFSPKLGSRPVRWSLKAADSSKRLPLGKDYIESSTSGRHVRNIQGSQRMTRFFNSILQLCSQIVPNVSRSRPLLQNDRQRRWHGHLFNRTKTSLWKFQGLRMLEPEGLMACWECETDTIKYVKPGCKKEIYH